MNIYQTAADALKEAVKNSLDTGVSESIQSELWRHYQGVQSIANRLKSMEDPLTGGLYYDAPKGGIRVDYYSDKSNSDVDQQDKPNTVFSTKYSQDKIMF